MEDLLSKFRELFAAPSLAGLAQSSALSRPPDRDEVLLRLSFGPQRPADAVGAVGRAAGGRRAELSWEFELRPYEPLEAARILRDSFIVPLIQIVGVSTAPPTPPPTSPPPMPPLMAGPPSCRVQACCECRQSPGGSTQWQYWAAAVAAVGGGRTASWTSRSCGWLNGYTPTPTALLCVRQQIYSAADLFGSRCCHLR